MVLPILAGIFCVQVKVHLMFRLKLIVMTLLNILHIMTSPVLVWPFAVHSYLPCVGLESCRI